MKMLQGIYIPSKNININAGKYFIPASNTKILTSLFAIDSLGEDYNFKSIFTVREKTLYIKTLGNPLITEEDIDGMVKKIEVAVDTIVLDIRYLFPTPRPQGWCVDDIGMPYAPPVSEINYNFNRVEKLIHGKRVMLSVNDPVNYFINSLKDMLNGRNNRIRVRFSRTNFDGETFAERSLGEILKIMNKNSENIIAEMLLLHSGMVKGKTGLKASLDLMRKSLISRGLRSFRLYDGSGLSYYNLVTPMDLVRALEILSEIKIFVDSLPVGGKDGTLKNRLNSRVIAKTGTLNNVQNLSGYIDGDTFSIMLNGVIDQKEAKEFIDSFLSSSYHLI